MNIACNSYRSNEAIPVDPFLKNKKLKKYFNRETSAALATVGKLLGEATVDPSSTALYYATGILEYEDYGLDRIAANALDADAVFSPKRFIENGIAEVSPLNQFKVLLNMPLSFIAIEYGFKNDNAVIYSSAVGLLTSALCAPPCASILLGAGKTFADGAVEMCFALTSREEVRRIPLENPREEAYLTLKRIAFKDTGA
jgi:hypothetical protein